ncbi:MAG: hypothetical protein M1837_003593 [Sclerophora amabilis]|nr:MAG: hypothetical protein M1837_003593 [Sclerophora amabilis]
MAITSKEVPGSSPKFLSKSRSLDVDCIAYDLEDSVAPAQKATARLNIRHLLEQPRPSGIREQAVRINSVESGLALDDLTEVLQSPNLDTLVVPKVQSASDLHFIQDVIRHHRPSSSPSPTPRSSDDDDNSPRPLTILALIESARSLVSLSEICSSTAHLDGLIFAAEDFALDLSLTRTPSLSEFLYARSAIVTAARAHNLASTIDLVCTAYSNTQGRTTTTTPASTTTTTATEGVDANEILASECTAGKTLGFNGKQCIHPLQVATVQRTFSPSDDELTWATRVVIAGQKAATQGRGSWGLDGKMVDAPVVGKASAVVARAEACGLDVEAERKKWTGVVEPE